MKKIYLFFLVLILGGLSLNAQVLYSDNFDTYTSGVKVAQTIGTTWWSTWSNAPGGTEDAVFSNTQSVSPSNSVYVAGVNDLIFKTNDKVAGRFELSWQMFVPTSHIGYFNILHNFNGGNSDWGFQAYMYNDSVYVDAAGAASASATFTRNVWHIVKLVIDIDDDFASFYLDGNEVVSYQWSKGVDGSGTLNKLDAIDFYAWDGTGSPTPITNGTTIGYYFDDLLFEQVTAPDAPTNLTAVVNGADIDVNWTAPTTTPDNYKLSRNGSIIFTTPSALTYTDVAPWPNTYVYMVRAGYGVSGYSHSSNTASAIIPGGVLRNLVLMEGGTGTWCQYCPGAAMGLRDLIEVNSKAAAAIEYHSGDTYAHAAALTRLSYYNITAFPTMVCDGNLRVEGGNATVSMYPNYLGMYNQRINLPGFHTTNISIVPTTPDNYTATITIEQNYEAWANDVYLFTALTESNIPDAWENQTEVDFCCRAMYPDASGTLLDFSSQTIQTVILNFSTTGYVKNNCEFVAFVQHAPSKEVTQVVKVDMSSILEIKELTGEKISIYPNPTSDYMMLLSNGKGIMSISDITGKIVYISEITNTTQYTDISKFSKGIYIVKVTSDEKLFTQKLVVE